PSSLTPPPATALHTLSLHDALPIASSRISQTTVRALLRTPLSTPVTSLHFRSSVRAAAAASALPFVSCVLTSTPQGLQRVGARGGPGPDLRPLRPQTADTPGQSDPRASGPQKLPARPTDRPGPRQPAG